MNIPYIHNVVQSPPISGSETFQKNPSIPGKQSLPIAAFPWALSTTGLCSVSVHSTVLDVSYKWNRTVYDTLCLASVT